MKHVLIIANTREEFKEFCVQEKAEVIKYYEAIDRKNRVKYYFIEHEEKLYGYRFDEIITFGHEWQNAKLLRHIGLNELRAIFIV